MKKRNQGFSKDEITLIISILVIFAAIAIPVLSKYYHKANVAVDISKGQEIGKATDRILKDNNDAFYAFFEYKNITSIDLPDDSNNTGKNDQLVIVAYNDRDNTRSSGTWKCCNEEQQDFINALVKSIPNNLIPAIESSHGKSDHWVIGYRQGNAEQGTTAPDPANIEIWIVEGSSQTHIQGGGAWHKVYPDVSIDSYINKEASVFFNDLRK